MINFLIFIGALVLIIKSADLAMNYSSRVAKDLHMSKHLMGFLIVALISVLPEFFISIMATVQGEPSMALGTLFGSNVADLTLIFALIIFFAKKEIKISGKIVKSSYLYLLTLAVPLVLGMDGFYSRGEGAVLIGLGILFYVWLLKKDKEIYSGMTYKFSLKNISYLIFSMGLLLVASYLTVKYGIALAHELNFHPILVGLLGISIGTTLPELFFSVKAVKKNHDELALGDVLGNVIIDAVIVVGLVALIKPFAFPMEIIYITGFFMFLGAIVLFYFMKTDRKITRKEACLLFAFYLLFVFSELFFGLGKI